MIGIFIKKQLNSTVVIQNTALKAADIKKSLLGKSKNEIMGLWGIEDNYFDLDEWSYFIKKNIFGGSVYLLLNFNRTNHVIKIRKRTLY